jgi:hypothetical protein
MRPAGAVSTRSGAGIRHCTTYDLVVNIDVLSVVPSASKEPPRDRLASNGEAAGKTLRRGVVFKDCLPLVRFPPCLRRGGSRSRSVTGLRSRTRHRPM